MQGGSTLSSEFAGGYLTSTCKHAFLIQIVLQNKQFQGSQSLNMYVFQPL
jgi:hypothetical protein